MRMFPKTCTPIEHYLNAHFVEGGVTAWALTVIVNWNEPDVEVRVFEKDGVYDVRWLDPAQFTNRMDVYEGSRDGLLKKFPWLAEYVT